MEIWDGDFRTRSQSWKREVRVFRCFELEALYCEARFNLRQTTPANINIEHKVAQFSFTN